MSAPDRRKRAVVRWVGLAAAVVLAIAAAWWMTHPTALPQGQPTVTAKTPVTKPLYFGILGPDIGGGTRTLELTHVTIPIAEDPGTAKATAYICRGGAIAQTSNPHAFCPEFDEATGASLHLGAGDQLVISVESHTEGVVRIDPLVVTYREGLQSGTQPTGPKITVQIIPLAKPS